MLMSDEMSGYEPGVCNIGKDEIRKRYAFGVAALLVSALFVCVVVLLRWPHLALLLVFIPLMMGFEGLFQGYFGFCAGFASAGIYDLTGSGGKRGRITNKESHNKDLKMAKRIHIYSIVLAIVVAIVVFFVV